MTYAPVSAAEAGPAPDCSCHGEPMWWNKDASRKGGGRWMCVVQRRESDARYRKANPEKHRENFARWRKANPEKAHEASVRCYAAQLARGEQIAGCPNHHTGMAELKAQLGDPRPEGLQLSLVNWDGPDSYWGYTRKKGERVPYRLSTNPNDYAWETQAENEARKMGK